MAIKLKKTLYVGVGGTGIATLLKVKKCFIDSYGEIPPMIGFLAIDTDRGASNKQVTSNRDKPITLTPSELLVCSVRGALQVYRRQQGTCGWVPSQNVNALIGIQGGGAGQVRSNGHFIAYYNRISIENSINAVINQINQNIRPGSPYEVDYNVAGEQYPVNINVVGSIAGGTGSGMMTDILCIIHKAFKNTGTDTRVYPWIVLPEVFRAMAVGPAMANVLYNTYGALKELDYLMHYDTKTSPINFGYTTIGEPLFDYAYVINNTNSAGVSFNSLDDITDVMAKSMFLPANKMGDAIDTPFDNVRQQKIATTYDILNKKAWAAATSSAELIYDGQAVGRVYAYRIMQQLCASMLQSPTDGAQDATHFVDDPNVLIRENKGMDNVIDALLSSGPDYMLDIDENTQQTDIDAYINTQSNEGILSDTLTANLNNKYANAAAALDTYIAEIMSRQQGKVDAAIKFLQALKDIVALCKGEMQQEEAVFRKTNATPVQWDYHLNAVRKKSIFFGPNKQAIDVLQSTLTQVVTNRREEIRRKWALAFYNQFETQQLNPKLQALLSLKATIEGIAAGCTRRVVSAQQAAKATSNFQIFLHEQDVATAAGYVINDSVKAAFVAFLGNGMSSWIGQSQDYIEKKLRDFAKGTGKVKEAVKTDIDTVLGKLAEDKVTDYLRHLKILASPLWTYDLQGYNKEGRQLDKFVVVGVGNRDTSILKTDNRYNTIFDERFSKASFASTNQYDRVYVLVVEALLPIYAVNNFKAYEYDHQLHVGGMANYIDETLNKRMNADDFNLLPSIEADNTLELWVKGFVFDLIHFDRERDTYWMRSERRGDPLRDDRYDLNRSRDVAYDMFKSEQLFVDVENTLNATIKRNGTAPIEQRINEIKENRTYLKEVSQLSPLEKENIDNPRFRPVRDLMEKEIRLMTNGQLNDNE